MKPTDSLFKNLVFLPAWNEERTVGEVVAQIRIIHPDFDVLVVDDGSTDSTHELARNAGAFVIRLPVNLGVGGAIKCAMRYASENSYTNLFQIDADGQHNPSYLVQIKERLEEGSDLVVGTRFGGVGNYSMGRSRKFASKSLRKLIFKIIKVDISDPTSGLRGFSKSAIEALRVDFPTEYLGDTLECLILAHHAGLKIVEVPVEMRPRQGGEPSKGSLKSFGYLLRAIFAIFVLQIRHAIAKRQIS
jgi:glycosyltransferase involved in cell wall biosynthesis